MERSSSSSSSWSGGPVVVEVWRDFGVWPVTEGSPAGVLDRVAALGVAVEVAGVGDADQAASTRGAAAADAEVAPRESAEAAADAAAEADADAGEGLEVSVSDGVWESRLARVVSAWWLVSCPGWVSAQWADVRLSPQVRDLMTLPPGPALLAAVAAIPTGPCRVDHSGEELPGIEPVPGTAPGWACACQVVVAAAWDACSSWTQVQSASALVATTGTEPVVWSAPEGCGGVVTDPVAEELAPALRLSPSSTGNRIAAARRLVAVPAMTALVGEGLLGVGPARLIADDLAVFPAEDVTTVTTEVAAQVRVRARSGLRAWTGTEIRQRVARALLRLGSAKVAKARRQARRGRRVTVTPDSHGMAWLGAYMSGVDAARIYARLTAIAKGIDDPERGIDATRCDLLIDALLTSRPATTTDTAAAAGAGDRADAGTNSGTGPNTEPGAYSEPDADAPADTAAEAGAGDRAEAGADAGTGLDVEAGAYSEPDAGAPAGSEAGPEAHTDSDAGAAPGSAACPAAGTDADAGSGRPAADAGSAASARRAAPRRGQARTPPTGRRVPAEVCVVVNLTTLLGLDQDPGEIPGVGPIPADEARELAADGSWRAWITDAATGQVIDTGRRSYTPSAALARLIRAREPYCRMPGCRRRAINCDLDHTVPWPTGSTTEANLGPLCRRHHRLKTHFGFGLQPEPSGPDTGPPEAGGTTAGPGWNWTMPSGLTYRDAPNPPLDP